jgi:biotin carboxyl carrier protein
MELIVAIDGRSRTVRVSKGSDGVYLVAIDDGPVRRVHADDLGAGDWALRLDGARRVVGAHVVGDQIAVQVDGRGLVGTAIDARTAALRLGAGGGEGRVATQMPGAVVRVLVVEGQHVSAGDPVVVVEAMKMENELRAPIDGVVATLHVAPGQAVETGAALVTIEPVS